jgi:hypothetical protein
LDKVIEFLSNIFVKIPPLVSLVITFLFGLLIYWRGCVETRKNKSSIYDTFLIASVFSVIMSRIAYIIIDSEDFMSYIWYWLPYEKYGNDIYLFRLLPWRFFAFWDGGIVLIPMFVSLLIILTLLVLWYKKWSWKQMFITVYTAPLFMLSISFLNLGIIQQDTLWILEGALLLLSILLMFVIYSLISKEKIKLKKKKSTMGWLASLYVLLSSTGISYVYLSSEISVVERVFVYVFIGWTVIFTLFYLISLRQGAVFIEKLSSVSNISVIDINHPVKLPKK